MRIKSMTQNSMARSARLKLALFAALVFAAVAVAAASGGEAQAAGKPVPVNAALGVAVTSISDPIPAGASGRVRIESEMLAGGVVVTDTPALIGAVMTLEQKSNELFDGPLPFGKAVNGSSAGSFELAGPSGIEANGRYHLQVSNIPGCQVLGQGHWSTTGGSNVHGRGTVTSCLNFDLGVGTFIGSVSLSGTLN